MRQLFETIETWQAAIARRSCVHNAILGLVWLTIATSGLVFSEPCPTDVLTLALIVLLPVVGLVRYTPLLAVLLMTWAALAATGLVSATFAADTAKAVTHTLITLFLAGGAFTFAGFVAMRPLGNTRLIFNGLTFAAVIAAASGIAGYFDLFPGADMFTKFDRAAGTFKDPNVFGPFLVPSILYAVQKALDRPLKRILPPLALAGFLSVALFLSFSRGAWVNLAVALAAYLWLSLITAESRGRIQKIAFLAISGIAVVAAALGGITQNEQVASLLNERASISQSYDAGPEGRFGGQEKAIALLLANPLGIGSAQFAPQHHHEEAHNVYLSMTLATGWAGSGLYLAVVAWTLLIGFREARQNSPWQPFVIIAVAAFAANVAEGLIIDSDHWRHFYLLMGLIWGSAAAREPGHVRAEVRGWCQGVIQA